MFFSCFKSKKSQNSEEGETAVPETSRTAQKASKKDSTKKSDTKNLADSTATTDEVKLAPRSAVLQTPKQAVGERISEATSDRRKPSAVESIPETAQVKMEKSKHETPANIEGQDKQSESPGASKITENQQEASQEPAQEATPLSGLKPIFSINQQDELKAALAKRAAKQQSRNEVIVTDGADKEGTEIP